MNIGWILGSMILVSGGFVMSSLAMGIVGLNNPYVGLLFWAAGAFVAGFVSARASEGKTIVEPAIGAGAFVAALILAMVVGPFGEVLKMAFDFGDSATIAIVIITLSMMGGGIGGAYMGEKTQEGEGDIAGPMLIFLSFLMVLGGLFLGLWVAMFGAIGSKADALINMILLGFALGGLIGGFAAGRAGASSGNVALGSVLCGVLFTLLSMSGGAGATGGIILTVIIFLLGSVGGLIGIKTRAKAE